MTTPSIKGNFLVKGLEFPDWFNTTFKASKPTPFLDSRGNLYRGIVDKKQFKTIFSNLKKLTGKDNISINEFIAIFCFIYNEVGGSMKPISEIGSKEYIENAGASKIGYAYKERGRGLNQLTGVANYRVVLGKLGYNYDTLSSEELDTLFQKEEVYLGAFRIYLTDPSLAIQAFKKADLGDFYAFGKAISGGHQYATLFSNRATSLKNALEGNISEKKSEPF